MASAVTNIPTATHTTTDASSSELYRLPAAIVLYMADSFLNDSDTLRFALGSHTLHAILTSYNIKRDLRLETAIEFVDNTTQSISTAHRALSAAMPHMMDDPLLAASILQRKWRIGRVRNVSVYSYPGCDDHDIEVTVAQIASLPQSTRTLNLEYLILRDIPVESIVLPPRLDTLVLSRYYAARITSLRWPPTLTRLTFPNSSFTADELLPLPDSLTDLTIGCPWNQPLNTIRWPPHLRILRLGNAFNQLLDDVLPATLESLDVGESFNQPIHGDKLPRGLTQLTFSPGSQFNSPLTGSNWPPLSQLELPSRWNQPLDIVHLPDTITSLKFPWNFTRSVSPPIHLPTGLTELSLHCYHIDMTNFNDIVWPAGLRVLVLPASSNIDVTQCHFPSSLQHLELGGVFSQPLLWASPPAGLTYLDLGWSWNLPLSQLHLPANLTHFELPESFNPPLEGANWPAALTSLTLGRDFDHSLRDAEWPPHLRKLVLSKGFQRPLLDWNPPASLTDLHLTRWDQPVNQLHLPDSLIRLNFGFRFNQSLDGYQFPVTLTSITFCDESYAESFHHPLVNWLPPPALRELRLGDGWDLPVSQLRLPSTLQILHFGNDFNHPLDDSFVLPSGLRELHIGSCSRSQFNQPIRCALPCTLRRLLLPGKHFKQNAHGLPDAAPDDLREIVCFSYRQYSCAFGHWFLHQGCVIHFSCEKM